VETKCFVRTRGIFRTNVKRIALRLKEGIFVQGLSGGPRVDDGCQMYVEKLRIHVSGLFAEY